MKNVSLIERCLHTPLAFHLLSPHTHSYHPTQCSPPITICGEFFSVVKYQSLAISSNENEAYELRDCEVGTCVLGEVIKVTLVK
jgi:hypothetical protein